MRWSGGWGWRETVTEVTKIKIVWGWVGGGGETSIYQISAREIATWYVNEGVEGWRRRAQRALQPETFFAFLSASSRRQSNLYTVELRYLEL